MLIRVFTVSLYRQEVIERLQSEHSVVILVTNSLTNYMDKMRQLVRENPEIDANTFMPDGRYNHIMQIQERLNFLRFLLKVSMFDSWRMKQARIYANSVRIKHGIILCRMDNCGYAQIRQTKFGNVWPSKVCLFRIARCASNGSPNSWEKSPIWIQQYTRTFFKITYCS